MALHLLAELDSRAREMTLEQWKPELIFEVKARRLRLLRGKAGRSEAEKIACCQKWSHCLPGSSLWILLAPRCCAHNSRIIHIAPLHLRFSAYLKAITSSGDLWTI